MISKGLYGKQNLRTCRYRGRGFVRTGWDHRGGEQGACVWRVRQRFSTSSRTGQTTTWRSAMEYAAEVLEVGKNVTTVAPGDRVIIENVSMCGICDDCKSGHRFAAISSASRGSPAWDSICRCATTGRVRIRGTGLRLGLSDGAAGGLPDIRDQRRHPIGRIGAGAGAGAAGLDGRPGWRSCAGFVAITGLVATGSPAPRRRAWTRRGSSAATW